MSPLTIDVQQTSEGDPPNDPPKHPMTFLVTVRDGKSATQHRVTMTQATYQQLTGGTVTAARCIEAAFQFLLDHEPKESILSRFDVTVISSYFPAFDQKLGGYLSK
jgi:hypothetical protein